LARFFQKARRKFFTSLFFKKARTFYARACARARENKFLIQLFTKSWSGVGETHDLLSRRRREQKAPKVRAEREKTSGLCSCCGARNFFLLALLLAEISTAATPRAPCFRLRRQSRSSPEPYQLFEKSWSKNFQKLGKKL